MSYVDLGELPKIMTKFQQDIIEAAYTGHVRAAHKAKYAVVASTPVAEGALRQAWQIYLLDDRVTMFNDVPYSGVMELGARRGFWPPIEPLAFWAQRKMDSGKWKLPRGTKARHKRERKKQQSKTPHEYYISNDALLAAYKISEYIHKNGIRPRYMVGQNWVLIQKLDKLYVAAEIDKAFKAHKKGGRYKALKRGGQSSPYKGHTPATKAK